jgi:hypothetical protein
VRKSANGAPEFGVSLEDEKMAPKYKPPPPVILSNRYRRMVTGPVAIRFAGAAQASEGHRTRAPA